MYCPRCSKEFAPGTSYCRTCGLSLGAVVEIVTGDAENEPEIKKGPNEKLTRAAIGSFVIGSVIGLCTPIFKNLELFNAAAITSYVFLLLIMLAILLVGAGVVFPQKRYIRKKGKKGSPKKETKTALQRDGSDSFPRPNVTSTISCCRRIPANRIRSQSTRPGVSG